jgi:hypothetical protein
LAAGHVVTSGSDRKRYHALVFFAFVSVRKFGISADDQLLPQKEGGQTLSGGKSAFFLRNEICQMVPINEDLLSFVQFLRRKNQNGTVDSICSDCAGTVARSADPATLDEAEVNHHCPYDLYRVAWV